MVVTAPNFLYGSTRTGKVMTKREQKLAQLKARGESEKRVAYLMKSWDAAEARIARMK